MDRDDVQWRGYWPACPTPFRRDGSFDADAMCALLEWYIGEGMHGVFVNGTTGEWFSQSFEERRLVAETAIDAVGGRIPIVIGCTAYTAKEAAELGRHALAAGADGIGSTPPPYAKTYDDETVQYYRDVSDGVDGPIMIYNWPHGTSVDIGPDLAERLVEVENVVGLKDSTPNDDQFYETVKRVVGRVRVFGPFMSSAGLDILLEHGGDVSSAAARSSARRTRSTGRPCGAATSRERAPMPDAPTSSFRSSGCPAAGAASSAPTRAS